MHSEPQHKQWVLSELRQLRRTNLLGMSLLHVDAGSRKTHLSTRADFG
jgi:hypothetical protein